MDRARARAFASTPSDRGECESSVEGLIKCWSERGSEDGPPPNSYTHTHQRHICNSLPFTSDNYGALVLSSLCPAAHQGPHQGNAPAKYRSPIRRPSSDKQDKQVQFLAGQIKDWMQSPWPISSRHKKKIKHR